MIVVMERDTINVRLQAGGVAVPCDMFGACGDAYPVLADLDDGFGDHLKGRPWSNTPSETTDANPVESAATNID